MTHAESIIKLKDLAQKRRAKEVGMLLYARESVDFIGGLSLDSAAESIAALKTLAKRRKLHRDRMDVETYIEDTLAVIDKLPSPESPVGADRTALALELLTEFERLFKEEESYYGNEGEGQSAHDCFEDLRRFYMDKVPSVK